MENGADDEDFQINILPVAAGSVMLGSLEILQESPVFQLPEPFDIVNHAGNLSYGGSVAILSLLALTQVESMSNGRFVVSLEAMSRYKKYCIPLACAATALLNATVETKWGVKHLPFAKALGGTVPDKLDMLYSTVWCGLASMAFWRRPKAAN